MRQTWCASGDWQWHEFARALGQGAKEGDLGAPRENLLVQVILSKMMIVVLGHAVNVKTLTDQVEMKVLKRCQPDKKFVERKGCLMARSSWHFQRK
jgi:hypothetical protein